ncbi:MAG: hypothetical protein ABFD11_10000, partial [Christensenella sp.]
QFSYLPLLKRIARSVLDLRHDEAERPLRGVKRGGETVSKGAEGAGFQPRRAATVAHRAESRQPPGSKSESLMLSM